MSATAEGFDYRHKDRPSLLVLQREGFRVIYGDGKINTVTRNGSDRESMLEAGVTFPMVDANPKAND